MNSLEHRLWRRTPKKSRVLAHRVDVERSRNSRRLKDRLELTREQDTAIHLGVVQRLYAKTVARNEQ